ncbi:hypothetical protein [Falsiroseomonas sp.]|uniref:hypothetical protein n=1 Tax=Falsiroseomonas sp. TaxID=2870721 RepID=UPI0035689DCB
MTARRIIRPSPGRQTIADLSWASLRVPRCVITARLALPRARAARAALPAPRPPWTTIFLKGLALAAEGQPELRRVHATLPSPRLIEVPHAIGCIVLERDEAAGPLLGMARFTEPHATPLPVLAEALRAAKRSPAENVGTHRRQMRFARQPWPLRRLLLRYALAIGRPLLRYGGTFAVSALGRHGAAIVDSVSVLPCFLSYGPISETGELDAYLSFDHRVMDGADGATALHGLGAAIEGQVARELEALRPSG